MSHRTIALGLVLLVGTAACADDNGPVEPLATVAADQAPEPGVNFSSGIPATFGSALRLDTEAKEVDLPLFRGEGPEGGDVYYILTESSDFEDAVRRGINWAPKLTNALGTPAVQVVTVVDQGGEPSTFNRGNPVVQFAGTVDFTPVHSVTPGPDGFPPAAAQAGSVADDYYTPLFTAGDGIVYNAPHVANSTGVHDDVLGMDTRARGRMIVTLRLVDGFYEDDRVLYINTEASDPLVAALESATFTPRLAYAPAAGDRDPATSSRESIIPVVNGPRGVDNPERQGLQSAVLGEGDPLNIIREEQECGDPTDCSALLYSPLWDIHPVVWTQAAIDAGLRERLTHHRDVIDLYRDGYLVSPPIAAGPANPLLGDILALGVVVNCPNLFVELGEEDDEE
ncbi:MAG: hypothetical protein GWN71_22140 [Gammaproteobacteria bacterium]|nr:hypothetical protein [Gammaproteobacteria bacterium]